MRCEGVGGRVPQKAASGLYPLPDDLADVDFDHNSVSGDLKLLHTVLYHLQRIKKRFSDLADVQVEFKRLPFIFTYFTES